MLVLISVDLMWEWLVVASGKMMGMEYATCLATFIFIMVAGIETGLSVFVYLSVCLCVCLSVCLSLFLSVCVTVCVSGFQSSYVLID